MGQKQHETENDRIQALEEQVLQLKDRLTAMTNRALLVGEELI